jgi:phosphoribosyl 1,2-cyclic phosphate phosphodiesterase
MEGMMNDPSTPLSVIVLGSGTSQGIPIIGCRCATCQSTNPKDKRLRVSVYIDVYPGKSEISHKILIDTSPDFRQQMLVNKLDDIDAILYTHHHIDHIMGLDDIRQINQLHRKSVDVYGNEATIKHIHRAFSYIFDENTYKGGGIPDINVHVISLNKFSIKGIEITPIEYLHGPTIVWGYRIGNFAYLTDCSEIPEKEFGKLEGLEYLIIDALRYKPHPTHYSIDEAVKVSRRINAKQTYFTHMTHDLLHDETNSKLPENIQLAWDGLSFEL